MSNILGKVRNRKNFEENIQTRSPNTQQNFRMIIRNFDKFVIV